MLAKRTLAATAIGLGFLSTTSQVIILRELLVAFTGNELTLATTLATWLLSIAAGCFVFKRVARTGNPAVASLLFIIAAPTVVFQVILVRFLDPFVGALGEMMSPPVVIGLSAVTIAPGALMLGGLFVTLVAVAGRALGDRVIPRVYGYEALGSAAAGVVLSLYIFRAADAFMGLALAGLAGLACAACLALGGEPRSGGARRVTLIAACAAALAVVMVLSGWIDLSTRRIQWHPLRVAATEETPYGNLLVTDRDGVYDFYESGSLSHTVPDLLYAEESAHIPLLYHPAPRTVLVIGGAGSGILAEAAKHPTIERIDFVELDPRVIDMTRRFAPPGWLEGPPGIPVTPVYGDGRRFVGDAAGKYDVVISGVGLPLTLQTARYYTLEFFRSVRQVLEPEGVLAFKISSGGAYIGPELGALLASLKRACEEAFGEVSLLPGDYIHFVASPGLPVSALADSLPGMLEKRKVATSFLDESRLLERLDPLERAYLDSAITKYDAGVLNSDARPVSATYAVARWAKHFESGRLLSALVGRITPLTCVIGLAAFALIAVPVLVRAAGSPWGSIPGALTLYAMGLTVMFTQVLTIVAFQIVSGYVYGWIAALIAAFMLGLGLASGYVGSRRVGWTWYHLAALAAGLAGLPLVAAGILRYAGTGAAAAPHLIDACFMGLAFASGALGGTVFAAASDFIVRRGGALVEAGVLAYSLDLAGATVAGFTTGFLIIPSLGIAGSAYAVAAFNGALVAALLVWGALRAGRS